MNSEKRLKHLLQKYPSIMLSLSTPIDKTHPKHPTNPLTHPPIPPSTQTSKTSPRTQTSSKMSPRCTPRKRPGSRPSRLLLQKVVAETLACRICSRVLQTPVTLECGDTFCKQCLLEKASKECAVCGRGSMAESPRCNVLLQEIVNGLADGAKEVQEGCKKIHNYRLRSSTHEKERPLATVKRKYSETSQLAETIAGFDSEGSLSLDCTLCGRLLFDPITTACGHTFCRGCVARLLDYGLACPLCMSPMPLSIARDTGPTQVLEMLVQNLRSKEYSERERVSKSEIEMVDEESQLPVFVCTSSFPSVACPLYVYEPRYRLLTRRCLQSSRRRFAMAAPAPVTPSPRPGADLDHSERFASYGTVLEVKDAVYLEDGTSILTTVGVRRFRVVKRGEKDGYDTASISYITDTPHPCNNLPSLTNLHSRVYHKALRWLQSLPPALHREISQSLGPFPSVEPSWARLEDGPGWVWWLLAVLPLSARLQLAFLSTTSLEKRLKAVDKLLDRMHLRMRMEVEVRTVKEEETCGSTGGVFVDTVQI